MTGKKKHAVDASRRGFTKVRSPDDQEPRTSPSFLLTFWSVNPGKWAVITFGVGPTVGKPITPCLRIGDRLPVPIVARTQC